MMVVMKEANLITIEPMGQDVIYKMPEKIVEEFKKFMSGKMGKKKS
jgi:hypothetical protein